MLITAACTGDAATEPTAALTTQAPDTTASTSSTIAPVTTTSEGTGGRGDRYGGEVVVGYASEPPTLNPLVPGGTNLIVGLVGNAHLAGVYRLNGATRELEPFLVEELPTTDNGGVVVNDDGTMTVSYRIKEDAVWSDGVPISGEDFAFTYELHMDAGLPTTKVVYDRIIPESVEAGPKTFSFTMSEPTVRYELLFDVVVPAHAVQGTDFLNAWNDTMWPSGGPFIVESWVKGEWLRLVRNENYWGREPETGDRLPYLDSVLFRFIPSTTDLLDGFVNREIDVISVEPSSTLVDRLRDLEGEGADLVVGPGNIWEHLLFSFHADARFERNPVSTTASLKFRRAVAHLIDRDSIAEELLEGLGGSLGSYVDMFIPRLSTGAWDEKYPYDPDRAGELAGEVCAELGRDCTTEPLTVVFTTTSNNEERVRLADLLADMFTAAGIGYEVDLEDGMLLFSESGPNGAFDVAAWGWWSFPGLSGLVSVHDLWDPENQGPGGDNWYYWGTEAGAYRNGATARFAELRDEMDATVDVAELETLIEEAEAILSDEVVFVPLYSHLSLGAVWADGVANVMHGPPYPVAAGLTWNLEDWHRTDRN
jgi:peptide/nickel transport system substrate-binding protein